MPILQNKLVWKSIEALHDEAMAVTPEAESDKVVIKSRPAAVLHRAPVADDVASPAAHQETDVMVRIEKLLQKLEDTPAEIAPPLSAMAVTPENETPKDETPENKLDIEPSALADPADSPEKDDEASAIPEAPSPESDASMLSPSEDPASEDSVSGSPAMPASQPEASAFAVNDDAPQRETPVNITDDHHDQLAEIAAAIHQISQNRQAAPPPSDVNAPPLKLPSDTPSDMPGFDMNTLRETVADEVRRTMSTLIATELPNMMRQAVGDAMRDVPATTAHQVAPKAAATKKTAAIKKAVTKKAAAKKTATKKPAAKKAAKKSAVKK